MTLRGISMGAMSPEWSEIFEFFVLAVWLNSGLFLGFGISDPPLCSSSKERVANWRTGSPGSGIQPDLSSAFTRDLLNQPRFATMRQSIECTRQSAAVLNAV